MQYGFFNDLTKEYIITNPKTPVKWINYIGDLNFGGFVDQTGGALLCKGDPALNRIVKYIPQLPSSEFKGETMYIRVRDGGATSLFSPFFTPTLDQYTMYECHVGLGYTRIISEFYGIRCDITIFVPKGDHREIRDVKITNLRNREAEIDIIPLVEYTHFDALKQFTNADWVPQTMQSKCIEEDGNFKTLIQYAFMNKSTRVNFFTSNKSASSFETDRREFLGDNEYGTFESPLSLQELELKNNECLRGDNIAALMHHLGTVSSGSSTRIIFQLGQCKSIEEERTLIEKFRREEAVEQSLRELALWWNSYISKLQVNTPNKMMNTMMNIYNPRQCNITKNWSRSMSLYQMGFGERGIGIRDLSQDLMGIMMNSTAEAKESLKELLIMQTTKGYAMHQYNPFDLVPSSGDAGEKKDRPQYYSDDHLFIILAVLSYLKESGDFKFLNERLPYYNNDEKRRTEETYTVFDHIKRGIEFSMDDIGIHGLCHSGFADWADPINLPRGSESVFSSCLLGSVLKEFKNLLLYMGDTKEHRKYEIYYNTMKETVNKAAWDGSWYVSYFDNEGRPIGSNKNEKGKIYSHSESWAVISGFASRERAKKTLDSVDKLLGTEYGIKLSWPGYDGYEEAKGGITTYPPGAKENGGIFLHTNPWIIIANTIIGNGDRAFDYYRRISPIEKNNKIEVYEAEPYCYAQNILGDEHRQFGLGRNSWLSGTASWAYQATVKYILGVRADYGGLVVDPCVPKDWTSYHVSKFFRGSQYEIDVALESGTNRRISSVYIDNEKSDSNLIPAFDDGKVHRVRVEVKEMDNI